MINITKRIVSSKLNAVIFLIVNAAILITAVLICANPGGFGIRETISAGNSDGREKYLNSFGWEIDRESEECSEILLPSRMDGVMEEYANMQNEQGFDFSSCCGIQCKKFTYVVTNYPHYDGIVYATLYVRGNRVIGGDIHAAELNGFMHGIK